MRRGLLYLCIFLLLGLTVTGGVLAQPSDTAEVLVETDFSDGEMPDFLRSTEDGWTLETQDGDTFLQSVLGEQSELLFIPSGLSWTDYIFEVQVRVVEGSVGLLTRVPDNFCGGYGATFIPQLDGVNFYSVDDECNFTNFERKLDVGLATDEWFTLAISVAGTEIKVFINEEEILSAEDTAYTQGTVAVVAFSNSEVNVGPLKVTAIASEISDPIEAPAEIMLTAHAGEKEAAIEELFDLGLITKRGSLLFEEDYAWFEGSGNYFTPLARRSPRTNIVMAGELNFRVGAPGETEICTFLSRVGTNNQGTATTFLNIGIANTGEVVVIDRPTAGQNATTVQVAPLNLDMTEAHHLLIIAVGEELTLFVDGQQVFDKLEIAARSGSFGISLNSKSSKSRCEGRNIWVYQLD